MANKATLFSLLLILFFPISFSQPHFPHVICGFIFYDGAAVPGANVTITNERTGEILYNITNKNGYFSVSLGDMPSGWKNGDKIRIVAKKENLVGEGVIVVDENKGYQEINITMNAPLSVDFSYSPSNPSVNEKIKFYCLVNASYYQWNFDDGNISNNKNPEHVYRKAGNYSVTLMIKDKYGRVGTVTKVVHVFPANNQSNFISGKRHKNNIITYLPIPVIILIALLALLWKVLK